MICPPCKTVMTEDTPEETDVENAPAAGPGLCLVGVSAVVFEPDALSTQELGAGLLVFAPSATPLVLKVPSEAQRRHTEHARPIVAITLFAQQWTDDQWVPVVFAPSDRFNTSAQTRHEYTVAEGEEWHTGDMVASVGVRLPEQVAVDLEMARQLMGVHSAVLSLIHI